VASYVGGGGLTVVDQNDQEVGIATDPLTGLLARHVGDDLVTFYITPNGPLPGTIVFYHSTDDCSGDRYIGIPGGSGFVYSAMVHRGAIFYTKTDPNTAPVVDLRAYEQVEESEDAIKPGVCTPFPAPVGVQVGVVTGVADPVLANLKLPLRIK
jgi:hypothetical protein